MYSSFDDKSGVYNCQDLCRKLYFLEEDKILRRIENGLTFLHEKEWNALWSQFSNDYIRNHSHSVKLQLFLTKSKDSKCNTTHKIHLLC